MAPTIWLSYNMSLRSAVRWPMASGMAARHSSLLGRHEQGRMKMFDTAKTSRSVYPGCGPVSAGRLPSCGGMCNMFASEHVCAGEHQQFQRGVQGRPQVIGNAAQQVKELQTQLRPPARRLVRPVPVPRHRRVACTAGCVSMARASPLHAMATAQHSSSHGATHKIGRRTWTYQAARNKQGNDRLGGGERWWSRAKFNQPEGF